MRELAVFLALCACVPAVGGEGIGPATRRAANAEYRIWHKSIWGDLGPDDLPPPGITKDLGRIEIVTSRSGYRAAGFLVTNFQAETLEARVLYVNGKLVAEFEYDPVGNPDSWERPLELPLAGLRYGEPNTIAIRVHDSGGAGGIWRGAWIVFRKE